MADGRGFGRGVSPSAGKGCDAWPCDGNCRKCSSQARAMHRGARHHEGARHQRNLNLNLDVVKPSRHHQHNASAGDRHVNFNAINVLGEGIRDLAVRDVHVDNNRLFFSTRQGHRLYAKKIHFSCLSDRPAPGCADMAGLVLWRYRGQHAWNLNNQRMLSGYVHVKKLSYLVPSGGRISSSQTSKHVYDKIYRDLFQQHPDAMDSIWATPMIYRQDGSFEFPSQCFKQADCATFLRLNNGRVDIHKRILERAFKIWRDSFGCNHTISVHAILAAMK